MNISKVIHLFNSNDIHENFAGKLLDQLKEGNSLIREAAAECLAKIILN